MMTEDDVLTDANKARNGSEKAIIEQKSGL